MNSNNYNLNWYGKLTIDNIEEVVKLLRKLLDGKQYTFVACNAERGFKPDVRVNQSIDHKAATSGDAFNHWLEDGTDTPSYGGFNVCDTHGVWGLSTSADDQPYLNFERNKVTIEHKNGFDEKLWWCIAVQ